VCRRARGWRSCFRSEHFSEATCDGERPNALAISRFLMPARARTPTASRCVSTAHLTEYGWIAPKGPSHVAMLADLIDKDEMVNSLPRAGPRHVPRDCGASTDEFTTLGVAVLRYGRGPKQSTFEQLTEQARGSATKDGSVLVPRARSAEPKIHVRP